MPVVTSAQMRNDLSVMLHQFDVLQKHAHDGVLTLKSMQTAVYLFLGMTEQGLELHKVAKSLGFKQQSSADRVFYALADDSQMVRGGRCLGWFRIEKDQQDKRYRRIFLTAEGATVLGALHQATDSDIKWWDNLAWKDGEESKVHHLEAETGKFHWGESAADWPKYVDDPKWGESQEYAIPVMAWQRMPKDNKEWFATVSKSHWWVDTVTGAKWKGKPDKNPFRAKRTIQSVDFLEGMSLGDTAGWTRKRGDKGRWYLFEPNSNPETDDPDMYVRDADTEMLAKYLQSKVDAVIGRTQSLSEALHFADQYLNKNDFNRFRRGLHKKLSDHEKDLERKMGAEYRNKVAAEGMSQAATKHALMTEMELDAKGKHIPPAERARLETERMTSLDAAERLKKDGAVSSEEFESVKSQLTELQNLMKQLVANKDK